MQNSSCLRRFGPAAGSSVRGVRRHGSATCPNLQHDAGADFATAHQGVFMDKGSESFKSAVSAAVPGQQGFDYLIVGCGFAGSVLAERLATQLGQRVLIVDKRKHIGGNAYDRYNDDGLLVHPYGPHIFHTNSADIFDYLSRFTEWRPY